MSFVPYLNSKATVPYHSDVVAKIQSTKKDLGMKISLKIDDERISVTKGGSTYFNNDTYVSFTVAFIDAAWRLVSLSQDCTKSTRSTAGEDGAKSIAKTIGRHYLTTCRVLERVRL